jgi:hypothetical protein
MIDFKQLTAPKPIEVELSIGKVYLKPINYGDQIYANSISKNHNEAISYMIMIAWCDETGKRSIANEELQAEIHKLDYLCYTDLRILIKHVSDLSGYGRLAELKKTS